MAVSKVELANGEVLIDLTNDSVTPDTLAEGETAHDAAGEPIVGRMKSGGGVSVQADWNQTDETAADFIKNKPFGEVPTVILEEQELVVDPDEGSAFAEISTPINAGDILIVKYNGTPYECEVFDIYGNIAFGDTTLAGGAYGNGEPFVGMYMDGVAVIASADGAETFTVGISTVVVDKLPQKYYDSQSVFYRKPGVGDNYLYTDFGCTIKATKRDVVSAAHKMPIVVFLGSTYFFSVVTVTAEGDYATVYYGMPTTDGSLVFGALVTAEYTP